MGVTWFAIVLICSVVGEARSYALSHQSRRRMDLFMFHPSKQAFGLELLVNGNRASLNDHMERALVGVAVQQAANLDSCTMDACQTITHATGTAENA